MDQEFEKYKLEYYGPLKDDSTFQERIGEPEELHAIIGKISLNFSGLEKELTERIITMLQLDDDLGSIVTAELSFRGKVNMFSSLYHHLKTVFKFNLYKGHEDEDFKELVKAINKCEEYRNQVMHSEFVQIPTYDPIFRKKTTAKQKGLRKTVEQTTITELFNIADYIAHIEYMVFEFRIDLMKKKATNRR